MTTVLIALLFGGATGKPAVAVIVLVGGLALHLWLRSRGASPKLGELPIDERCDAVEAVLREAPDGEHSALRDEAEDLLRRHRPDSPVLAARGGGPA